MLTTIKGKYRNGRIEMAERPQDVSEDSEVIITFLSEGPPTERKFFSLRGMGKVEDSKDLDVEKTIREIRDEWKEELEEYGNPS